MPNRLATETSPYLLQHKDNPVDWYAWGEDAFAEARATGKPMLVSIGYAACHWCHVMAHESFENPEIAAQMNEWFVNIKVDREERPDVDALLMTAVQAMTGHGGWPLNVFLTSDGDPFYGGTYWPAIDRQGMPSISRVLEAVHSSYVTKPDDVRANAVQIREFIEQSNQLAESSGTLDDETREQAVARLSRHFDGAHGGFGSAPKFPQASVLDFLLHAAKRDDERARSMLETTLDHMAAGGMYDQIGGGFHRYAVDAIWLVPHFEKMLYDNAQLARVYHDAYRLTGTSTYRRITTEILDYVLAEMTHPDGGFYATQDADSEGVEGKFYIWSPSEVIAVLGEAEGTQFNRWFDISIEGNFEGHSIPHPVVDIETIAGELGGTTEQAEAHLAALKKKLYDVRAKRIWPGRDEKIILSWNGMMLRAFAEASRSLDRPDYRDAAIRNATFLLDRLKRTDGRLAHVWTNGSLGQPAFLDDLANFADGLLALYQATFDTQWLDAALTQTQRILDEFSDDANLGFFDTSTAHERLIARPRELQDGATPSGSAVAAEVLLKVAAMTADEDLIARIYRLTETMSRPMSEQPIGFGRWLAVADALVGPMKEIAIAGAASEPGVDAFAATVARRYEPNAVTGLADPSQPAVIERFPFLQFRPQRGGVATAYLCEHHTCMPPVTNPAALDNLLNEGTGVSWVSF
jgi:uncharacterized protein YyaL (SSP411 family)